MKFIVTISIVLLTMYASAQDVMHFQDGTTDTVQVLEVGVGVIKYRRFAFPDEPSLSVPIEKVRKIVYKSGVEEFFVQSTEGNDNQVVDKIVAKKNTGKISRERESELLENDFF